MVRKIGWIFLLFFFPLLGEDSFLRLEVAVEGEKPFYPQQKLHFVYRIAYRGHVQLTKETLPLLQAEGFEKIGAVDITQESGTDYTIQIISQEVKALQSGDYTFPLSEVEGFFNEDSSHVVKSTVLPFTVTIDSFPKKDQPLSFNGAMGRFTLETDLLTPPQVSINDSIRLKVTMQGQGDLSTVQLPVLLCQPGYSGFFSLSDLPPETKVEGDKKTFIIEMRPLTTVITEIPALEFSSFDPEARTYHTVTAPSIPLKVKEEVISPLSIPQEMTRWDQVLTVAAPASFPTVKFSPAWITISPWWWLLTPFVGLVVLWLYRQWSLWTPQPQRNWLEEIQAVPEGSDAFYRLVELALKEAGDEEFVEELRKGRFGKGVLPSPAACLKRLRR